MNEKKIKHLEFIQNNIARMSTNSFYIKGWSITILSALFAFAQKDNNKEYVLITYFAVPLFWYLNGFFLLQERRFRKLYDIVRVKDESKVDFEMNLGDFNTGKCTLLSALLAKSICPLYSFMLAISLLVVFCF